MARPAAADKSAEGSSSIAIPQQVLRAGRPTSPAGSGAALLHSRLCYPKDLLPALFLFLWAFL